MFSTKQLFLVTFTISLFNFCEAQQVKENSIGISSEVISTKAEALYFSLGNPKRSSSTTRNYGVNINYSRVVYRKFYGVIGAGYFKQFFKMQRPFEFDDPTNLLFYTKSYSYDNICAFIGGGFKERIFKYLNGKAGLTYNRLFTFKQKYTPTYLSNVSSQSSQTNKKKFTVAESVNLNFGIEQMLGSRFSVSLDAVWPVIYRWHADKMFYKYEYSSESQRAAINKSSIGATFSFNYHF